MIILASQSTARAAVLRNAGVSFRQVASQVDEDGPKRALRAQGAEAVALHLAHAKAAAVDPGDGTPVIGADQILVCEGAWLDKPDGLAGARRHLQALRGRTHALVTAVVLHRAGQAVWEHVAVPRLVMRDVPDATIDALLLADPDCVHCVGAYRVEGPGVQLFDAIEGEWAAVLGLPLLPLLAVLRNHAPGVLLACYAPKLDG